MLDSLEKDNSKEPLEIQAEQNNNICTRFFVWYIWTWCCPGLGRDSATFFWTCGNEQSFEFVIEDDDSWTCEDVHIFEHIVEDYNSTSVF